MPPRGFVLIVDDDDDTRSCVETVLREEGYDVRGACNGREALALLGTDFRPDLVLLDLMMPVMNGWQLLDALAKEPGLASLPIVLFTAAGDPMPNRAALAKPIVRKPIDIDLLLAMVNEYCEAGALGDAPPSDLLPRVSHPL